VSETPLPARLPFAIKALLASSFLTSFATVGQITILGKQVFDMTGRELDLGLLGLAEFVPLAVAAPFTGALADRFDRRRVFAFGVVGEVVTSLGLLWYVSTGPTTVTPIFGLVVVYGFSRALASPAVRALAIDITPPELIERVIALRSLAFQAGAILGPVTAGFLFVANIALPYLVSALLYSAAALLISVVPKRPTRRLGTRGARQALRDAREGLRFIRRQPVIFGAISLDLFAVLLGGVVALLPAIAEERLGVGAVGVGRAARRPQCGSCLDGVCVVDPSRSATCWDNAARCGGRIRRPASRARLHDHLCPGVCAALRRRGTRLGVGLHSVDTDPTCNP